MAVATVKSLLVVIAMGLGAANSSDEDIYVDAGACPGEGCQYGEQWIVKQPVALLREPNTRAPVLLTLPAGATVSTLTGQVHTIPGRFDIHRADGDFSIGDTVLVYTYLGEGFFRVLHNGNLKEAQLNFSPWGGGSGSRCENPQFCFGTLREPLDFQWWVYVQAGSTMQGWILFSNHDLDTRGNEKLPPN